MLERASSLDQHNHRPLGVTVASAPVRTESLVDLLDSVRRAPLARLTPADVTRLVDRIVVRDPEAEAVDVARFHSSI
jgi:hypothetical protein